jgi:hypothetical protein
MGRKLGRKHSLLLKVRYTTCRQYLAYLTARLRYVHCVSTELTILRIAESHDFLYSLFTGISWLFHNFNTREV